MNENSKKTKEEYEKQSSIVQEVTNSKKELSLFLLIFLQKKQRME